MRITTLYDKTIKKENIDTVQGWFSDFVKEHSGLDVSFWNYERDYTFYQTYISPSGERMPAHSFLTEETDFVFKKFGKWGTDHVVIFVHEDNWPHDNPAPGLGFWGINFSNIYHGYQVHLCRWSPKMVNSLGTMWHELAHSLDALVLVETGIDINPILGTKNADQEFVHGKGVNYDYIGRINGKENPHALKAIKEPLTVAYNNRKARFDKEYKNLQTLIINLANTLLTLLRQNLNRKQSLK